MRKPSSKQQPDLAQRKNLIVHTYDMFLVAQTRLFVLATSSGEEPDSDEIQSKKEILVLDDLTAFAISARRLIELIGLKSFANGCKIPHAYFDTGMEPYTIAKSETNIGFLSLVNGLIHASTIKYMETKFDKTLLINPELAMNYLIRTTTGRQPRTWQSIEPVIFVMSDKGKPFLISLKDMVAASARVAEKIVERCTEEKIFIELSIREV
jgi:hypothetical protein